MMLTRHRLGSGFTLVEVLVAIFLGSLVITVILTIYFSMHKTRETIERMYELQQQASFISSVLYSIGYQAGDWECQNQQPTLITPVKIVSRDIAREKLDIFIAKGSHLLLVHECMKMRGKKIWTTATIFLRDQVLYQKIIGKRATAIARGVQQFLVHCYLHQSSFIDACRYGLQFHVGLVAKGQHLLKYSLLVPCPLCRYSV